MAFVVFLFKTTYDLLIYTTLVLTLLAVVPENWFPNFPYHPIKYDVEVVDNLGNIWNNHLVDKSELLLKGQIVGPEAFAIKNDLIYTGLEDGRVVEINKKTLKVREVIKSLNNGICDETKRSECARFLGMKFGKDGHLYALDFYQGLYKINVKTSEKELIRLSEDFGYDDLEFDPQLNVVYASLITAKWPMNRCLHQLIEPDTSGYLLAFDLDTKKTYKLRSNMTVVNGLQLSKDQKHLFVDETLNRRVLKISIQDIHSAIKGNRELTDSEMKTFTTLPGEPDNVRLDPNGDLLVALLISRRDGKFLHDHLSNWPLVRKALVRAVFCIRASIEWVNTFIGSPSVQSFVTELDTGMYFFKNIPKSAAVVRIDSKSGRITKIYGSDAFNDVTQGFIDDEGDLYFGSFTNPFLGRIKKKDL